MEIMIEIASNVRIRGVRRVWRGRACRAQGGKRRLAMVMCSRRGRGSQLTVREPAAVRLLRLHQRLRWGRLVTLGLEIEQWLVGAKRIYVVCRRRDVVVLGQRRRRNVLLLLLLWLFVMLRYDD